MTFTVLQVTPLNSNTFRVFFNSQPQARSPLSIADTTNRDNWTITVVSGPGAAPVVEAAENPLPQPDQFPITPAAWSIDIRTNQRILASTVYLIVGAATLKSFVGTLISANPSDRGSCPGIAFTVAPGNQAPAIVATNGSDFAYSMFTGTFGLTPATDYALHSGVPALRKRILRRCITAPGEFTHLPQYGVGLQVKALQTTTSLMLLQQKIQTQILAEPDVASVEVSVTKPAPGVIAVGINVSPKQGAPGFEIAFQVSGDGTITV